MAVRGAGSLAALQRVMQSRSGACGDSGDVLWARSWPWKSRLLRSIGSFDLGFSAGRMQRDHFVQPCDSPWLLTLVGPRDAAGGT